MPPKFWQERVEAESGWDYTGRFRSECGYFIPVDLNSLLYKYEIDFANFAGILGLQDETDFWIKQAENRRKLMNKYLWSEEYRVYFDFNFQTMKQYGYYSLATFYPLWANLASQRQAARIQSTVPMFLQPGGMVTSAIKTGHQWDYPNGWAPLQWIVIKGLLNYGYQRDSVEIAERWISLCTQMFDQHGKLYEKYNVVDFNLDTPGRYPLQEGFGWTSGIYQKIAVNILGCVVE